MWQRIQTLYLAVSTILLGSMFFSSVARIVTPEGGVEKIMYSEISEYMIFITAVFIVNCLCLFAFKFRNIQMRLCIINAIVLLAFQIWLGVDYFRNMKDMTYSFTAVFPVISAILNVLAAKNIFLDEVLVQTSSRLRSSRRKSR